MTSGTLLGGRVAYTQPEEGFRSGIEPVLLAACIPARAGQTVLEAGTGAGAGLLCLAARVAGLRVVGIERDPALAAVAASNAGVNRMDAVYVVAGDITALPLAPGIDHAFANPPYHAAGGTPSPLAARRQAKLADTGLLAAWTTAMAAVLRHHGTLTLILPAAAVPPAIAALAAGDCPAESLLPLWPKPGRAAKLVLLRGIKGSRSPFRMLSGLVLHQPDGTYTIDAEAILRDAASLPMTAAR